MDQHSSPRTSTDARQQYQHHTATLESSEYLKIEQGFSMSPEQILQTTPVFHLQTGYSHEETSPFGGGTLQSPTDSTTAQAAYMTPQSQASSLWGGTPVRTTTATTTSSSTGGDEFDNSSNYALHGSPTLATGGEFPSHICSDQSISSPRSSWGSDPGQYRAMSWEPGATDPRQTQTQQQYTAGYPLQVNVSYVHGRGNNSPATANLPSHTSFPTAPSGAYLAMQNFDGESSTFPRDNSGELDMYHHATRYYCQDGTTSSSSTPSPSALGFKVDQDYLPENTDDILLSGSGSLYPYEPVSFRHGHSRQSSMASSPEDDSVDAPCTGDESRGTAARKVEELPYAQLIYQAFLSTKRHALTLQEIYQWFRENTVRGKAADKGWQNSIRHNLSMNKAFIRRDRTYSTPLGSDHAAADPTAVVADICVSSDAAAKEHSKRAPSAEWFLAPWAVENGVQSTTRYRKDNHQRRGAQGGGTKDGRRKGPSKSATSSSSANKRATSSSNHHSRTRNSTEINRHHHAGSTLQYLPQHHHLASHGLPAAIYHPTAAAAAPSYVSYAAASPYSAYTHSMMRTHSLSESGMDEPVTPEASFADGLSIPDLRGGASSSANANAATAHVHGYYTTAATATATAAGEVVDLCGFATPGLGATAAGTAVVYDEVVDQYGGWGGDGGYAHAQHGRY